MRILLTNNSLADRAGSELYIRDIAVEMMRRGHRPVAYSTNLGAVAEELRAATVPVIDRLSDLAEPLDVNFFDRRLFSQQARRPAAPKRALAFSNYSASQCLPVLMEACGRCGIELDVRGIGRGSPGDQPGTLLADYDIVFAMARSAIEAMAVGACVVLCAPDKLGPMVTTDNFSSLRRWNFGIRTLDMSLNADLLAAELQKYNCEDAFEVSQLVRANCELQAAADQIVDVYQRVLAAGLSDSSADRFQAGAHAAEYVECWTSRYKSFFHARSERDHWLSRYNSAGQALAQRDEKLRRQQAELEDRQHWIDRCLAAESTLLQNQRLLRAETEQMADVLTLLRRRDAEAAVVAQELRAIRASATWRWSQKVLQSPPVGLLFGRLIRSVAERSRTTGPAQLASRTDMPVDAPALEPAGFPAQERPHPAISDLQWRADRMISAHGFLGVPRETFAQAGREQLIALLAEGLCPESKVLEFGCGCLRIAYWLVRFLNSGGYSGIEPARARIDCGLRYLLTPAEHQAKQPHFDYNPTFNSSVFGTKFDFFLARSIWTHASKPQIEATLDSFLRDSAPNAIFLASYLPAQSPDDDYQGTRWIGTSHESDTPGVIRHALPWIVAHCRNRGLTCEEIPGTDCDRQFWLRIRLAS